MAIALPWEGAIGLGAAAGAVGAGLALITRRKAQAIGSFLREAAMLLVLYGLWQLAGRLALTRTSGALSRAAWIQEFDLHLPLPSEHALQQLVLGHPLVVQAANLYYAGVHFPATIAFLVWLFVRHREHYRPVRWVLVSATLCCLLIQFMPVAPPRMMPNMVDTALVYGQSVYGSGLGADELSAMPSVHVGWALLVAFYTWRIAGSRWRILGPAHAVLTVLVVVVTANHWWLDGIVAACVLVASAWMVTGVRTAWQTWRGRSGSGEPVGSDQQGVPAGVPSGEAASPVGGATVLADLGLGSDLDVDLGDDGLEALPRTP